MRRATQWAVWLFAFTVPWDVVSLGSVGTLTRLMGLLALPLAVLTTVVEGRLRKPDAIVALATVFAGMATASLLWTVSPAATLERCWTYIQLLGMVWMIREFARSYERQQAMILAYCLGAIIPIEQAIENFTANSAWSTRFAGAGFNENDLGLMLAIGLPMAWHLAMRERGLIRVVPISYLMLAPVTILLTGSRGSFLAALVALSIVPRTFPRLSLQSICFVAVVVIVVGVGAAVAVPEATWERIGTIDDELLGGGRLTGRVDIWTVGLILFAENPILGVGAGAFESASQEAVNLDYAPHNVLLAILVEQGVVGFLVFAALLGACAATIFRLPRADRVLWSSVLLCWLVGGMSMNWQYRKVTWFLFGLLAAQSVTRRTVQTVSSAQIGFTPAPDRACLVGQEYSASALERTNRLTSLETK